MAFSNLKNRYLESISEASRIFCWRWGVRWEGVGVCDVCVCGVCGGVWWGVGDDYRGCYYPIFEIPVSFVKTPYSRLTSRLVFPLSRIEYPVTRVIGHFFNYSRTRVFRSSIEYVEKPFKNTLFRICWHTFLAFSEYSNWKFSYHIDKTYWKQLAQSV